MSRLAAADAAFLLRRQARKGAGVFLLTGLLLLVVLLLWVACFMWFPRLVDPRYVVGYAASTTVLANAMLLVPRAVLGCVLLTARSTHMRFAWLDAGQTSDAFSASSTS